MVEHWIVGTPSKRCNTQIILESFANGIGYPLLYGIHSSLINSYISIEKMIESY